MNRFLCHQNSTGIENATDHLFSQRLSIYSVYTLPILALAGNSLTLLVILLNPQLNRSSFSVYVKSMAVSDTLVLLFKFLSYQNKTSKYYHPSLCTLLVFCADTSTLLSVWTIVLITIERTFVVLFPLHIKKFISACRARVLILIISLLTILLSARVLIIPIDRSKTHNYRCLSPSSWHPYIRLSTTIKEFSYCYIPLTIVIIGNLLTICAVKQAVIRRHDMLTNSSYKEHRQMDSNKNQLMLMLLIVTLMFIVYFVPFTITHVISKSGLPFGLCFKKKSLEIFFIMHALGDLLKDLNFCTNFIIYCVSGKRFRHAFFSLCKLDFHRYQSSFNSRLYDAPKNPREFLFKKNFERRLTPVSGKHTVEESQF